MKRWIQGLGIGILVAAVALAALWLTAGVAWAHGPEGTPGQPERPAWAGGNGTLLDVAAEALGLDRAELIAQLQDGKTLAQIAEERGVDPQAIADAFLAQRRAWLEAAVAEGRLTQAQADWMLSHMAEEIQDHLNEPFPMGFGYGMGNGMGYGEMLDEMTQMMGPDGVAEMYQHMGPEMTAEMFQMMNGQGEDHCGAWGAGETGAGWRGGMMGYGPAW